MKSQLIAIVAAVLVVGCGESQQSAPAPKPEPPTAKVPDISIHNAVIEGDIQAVNKSLEASMDINAKDEKGWAPMHLAAIGGNSEIAGLLLKSGANVNERTETGWTPLHLADNKEITQLLITKGANLNAKNNGGETPLDWAIKRKDIATADLLRKHGGKTGMPGGGAKPVGEPGNPAGMNPYGNPMSEELKAEGK